MMTSSERPSVSTGISVCSRQNSAGTRRSASGWIVDAQQVEERDAELQAQRHRQRFAP